MAWNLDPDSWGEYRDQPWSKWVLLARERQRRNLRQWLDGDPDFPYYWDEKAADHIVWFFRQLRHFDAPWTGQPFVLSDWQEWDVMRPLFGWKRRDTHSRRFSYALCKIARKNGKSPLEAGVGLYLMTADREPGLATDDTPLEPYELINGEIVHRPPMMPVFGAQVYSAATKEKQAKILWNYGRKMVKNGSPLAPEYKILRNVIQNKFLESSFEPLGGDSDTQDGFSVHGGLIDEWHAHKNTKMRDVLSSGTMARQNSLIFVATTAGYGGEESPCEKETVVAQQILDGTLEDESFFAFITTADDEDNWQNRDEWIRANPNWGISVFQHKMEEAFERAKADPEKLLDFKVKNLNIPQKSQANPYMNIKVWKSRAVENFDLDRLREFRCAGGLDMGVTEDLTAFALAWGVPDPDENLDYLVYLKCWFWCPEDKIKKKFSEEKVNYPRWVAEEWITATPGPTTRRDYVKKKIVELNQEFDIIDIGADRSHASELMENLADEGINVAQISQSRYKMNFPLRALKELTTSGRLRHDGNPVLAWNLDNAVFDLDAQERMLLLKDKSKNRIDGAVASAIAVGQLLINADLEFDSYEVITL